MSGPVLGNWPVILIVLVIIIGGSFYITFHRHGKATPDGREARAHFRRKKAATAGKPALGEHIPSEPVPAIDGLTIPRATSPDVEGAEEDERKAGEGEQQYRY